jgi:hypothetical protein
MIWGGKMILMRRRMRYEIWIGYERVEAIISRFPVM